MSLTAQRIAVALDHSEPARAAAAMAAELARATARPLVLLHAFEGHPDELAALEAVDAHFQGLMHLSDADMERARREGGRRLFRAVRGTLETDGLDIQEVILDGAPTEALLNWTREHRDSLLVMGRRGLSRPRAMLMGSVSDRLVREAACPVLIHR